MTDVSLKASLDGQPIWQVDWRKPPYDPKEPFYIDVDSREPPLKKLFDFSKLGLTAQPTKSEFEVNRE